MNTAELTNCLERNARRIQALVEDVPADQMRWRPDESSWSILEVICHLLDEERRDFRPRLEIVLFRPGDTWAAIDPEGWVVSHGYQRRDPVESLAALAAERDRSLAWLRGLTYPAWESEYAAPMGPLRAGDLLASWVAHDILHMRQIVELHHSHAVSLVGEFSPAYAGDW